MRVGVYKGVRIPSALHNELSGSVEGDRNEGSRDEARMVEPWLQDNRINDLQVEQGLDILQLLNTNYEGVCQYSCTEDTCCVRI